MSKIQWLSRMLIRSCCIDVIVSSSVLERRYCHEAPNGSYLLSEMASLIDHLGSEALNARQKFDEAIHTGYAEWSAVPERKGSREFGYRVNWLQNGRNCFPKSPSWRVSWIEKTGELYATPTSDRRDRFVVLGNYPTREDVEDAMRLWAEYETYFFQNLSALADHLREYEGLVSRE